MFFDEIKWIGCRKEDLPSILFGGNSSALDIQEYHKNIRGDGISVGFKGDRYGEGIVPLIIVIDDYQMPDVFSWVSTFFPDFFPLSQFARVVSRSDWERVEVLRIENKIGSNLTTWSNVIVGELFALNENRVDSSKIQFNWLHNTSSLIVARSALLYDGNIVYDIVRERLIQIEADDRFLDRPANTNNLMPIWSAIKSGIDPRFDMIDAIQICLRSAMRVSDSSLGQLSDAYFFDKFGDFLDESIEKRVVTYNSLSKFIIESSAESWRGPGNAIASAFLAAGAFLVGRGSSHVSLLTKGGREYSAALTWFSLMAGMVGRKCYDSVWMRFCTRAEKILRDQISIGQISNCDLSWAEFNWMQNVLRNKNSFLRIPKYFNNSLSIEIFPAVVGQFRLSGDATMERPSVSDLRIPNEISAEMESIIAAVYRSKKLLLDLGNTGMPHIYEQKNLFDENSRERKPRPRDKKR